MTTQRRRRRRPGQGSIRKRANGTWEARITIARVARSFYGRTRAEALAQIEAAAAPRLRPAPGKKASPSAGVREQAARKNIKPFTFEDFGRRAPFWPKDLDPDVFIAMVNDGLD